MARFDVYRNHAGQGYLLDLQADILDDLNTRIVAPLMSPQDSPGPAKRLNPIFVIAGEPHVMATQFIAAVPVSILRQPVATLKAQHLEITDAVDFLMQGF